MSESEATQAYRVARDQLLVLRGAHAKAVAEFRWPEIEGEFNWAVDWFDSYARGNDGIALWLAEADGRAARYTFADLVRRSDQVARWLRAQGVGKCDGVVLMLGSQVELWESMPKLVRHTQVSYPVGHLSTMYWLGLQPGDVHLNISSPGWAKHAWSCFFTPWIAGATIYLYNYARFDAAALLERIRTDGITTFCAPPTVWRMLIQADLAGGSGALREVTAAGEPLNPEVIEQVRAAWGLTLRDGFGQTETTARSAWTSRSTR